MKLNCATGTLTPIPPFDFEQSLDFIGEFPPMAGEQMLAPRSLTKTLSLDGQAVVFQITGRGDADKPTLDYTLYSASKLNASAQKRVLARIRFFLSLDDDLRPFYKIGLRDEKFAPVLKRFYGLHQVKFLSPFENAMWAVLTQRIPMRVAHKVKEELIDQYGARLTVNGHEYRAFPEVSQLFPVSTAELNAIVHNERKAQYLRAVIDAFHAVDEEFLYHAPTPQIREWLLKIKGIGEWSADFILLRGLGRMEELRFHSDAFYRNSLAMRAFEQAIGKVYAPNSQLTLKAMQDLAARYAEWQGYWAYYLRANN